MADNDSIDPGWRRFKLQSRQEMEEEVRSDVGSATTPELQTLAYVRWLARNMVMLKNDLYYLEGDVIRGRIALQRAKWFWSMLVTIILALWSLGIGEAIQQALPWKKETRHERQFPNTPQSNPTQRTP